MNSPFVKGLLAALIAAIATLISVQAASPMYYVITIVGVVLTYFIQHAFVKPISVFGTLDLTDFIKGFLMALGTAGTTYAAQLITGEFVLAEFLKVIGYTVVLYLTKNTFSDSNGTFAKNTNAEYQQYKDLSRRTRSLKK